MTKRLRSILFLVSTIVLVLSTSLSTMSIAESQNNSIQDSLQQSSTHKIDNKVREQMDSSDELSLIIILNQQIDAANIMKQANNNADEKKALGLNRKHMVRSEILTELKANAHQTQAPLLELLSQEQQKGTVKKYNSYHVMNAISFTGSKEVIEKVASFKEVKKIYLDEERNLVTDSDLKRASSDENVQWNVSQVLAPKAWELGIDGAGAVVASIDSGVQWDHPALKEKYRGYNAGDGTVDHQYSFLMR